MTPEEATKAAERGTPVVADGRTGRIDVIDGGDPAESGTVLARFIPQGSSPPVWVDVLDLTFAPFPEPAEPVGPQTLWDLVIAAVYASEIGEREQEETALDEIRRRLEAIERYRGTEATIIREIISGRREVDS